LRVRSTRRNPPDLKKLASALIELARAQAETDAEAEHARQKTDQPQLRGENMTDPPDGGRA
jgi:hypothetical protein